MEDGLEPVLVATVYLLLSDKRREALQLNDGSAASHHIVIEVVALQIETELVRLVHFPQIVEVLVPRLIVERHVLCFFVVLFDLVRAARYNERVLPYEPLVVEVGLWRKVLRVYSGNVPDAFIGAVAPLIKAVAEDRAVVLPAANAITKVVLAQGKAAALKISIVDVLRLQQCVGALRRRSQVQHVGLDDGRVIVELVLQDQHAFTLRRLLKHNDTLGARITFKRIFQDR